MDSIRETPVKSRNSDNGLDAGSQATAKPGPGHHHPAVNDYETVATLPLLRDTLQDSTLASYPLPHVTQPTQIVGNGASIPESPVRPTVQVPASSPDPPSPSTKLVSRGGRLAQSLAPPGTSFRLPMGVSRSPPQPQTKKVPVIELSDDEGMRYVGGSSDEDTQRDRRDIKPSVLKPRKDPMAARAEAQSPKLSGHTIFSQIMATSFYGASGDKARGSTLSGSVYDSRNRDESNTISRISAPKRPADSLGSAYGNSSRPAKQMRKQSGPAKALPVREDDMVLDDVEDYSQRQKIKRMQMVVPQFSVSMCNEALIAKRGNEEDALLYLADMEEAETLDLTKSDDGMEISAKSPPLPKKAAAKQQLKAPIKSIQEKYASASQAVRKAGSQPASPTVAAPKPKRKLMRGRRAPSSPAPVSPTSSPPKKEVSPISLDSDSGIASESDYVVSFDGSLLKFFNTCSAPDLMDIASVNEKIANLVLEKKPFKNLNQIRKIDDPSLSTNTKQRKQRRPVGDKIIDTCEVMWTGYRAIDLLVQQCQSLSKPIANEMLKWGVDVFGASKDGELDLVTFKDDKSDQSTRDSGIGTPKSGSASADEDGDVLNRKAHEKNFFPQPAMMAKDVVLKDYQIVGINWLSLLFKYELSCILADDMGLGKTCQVVAFLAHLSEIGVKGPHVIVVPGSTLENWLREFQRFCPTLLVMPYYAGLNERPEIREQIFEANPDVVITTYNIAKAKDDRKFLRHLKPTVCVYDEGHALKNSTSKVYEELMKIKCKFRLLLTGTPLQNNLTELCSLLGFILPDIFEEHREDLQSIFSHKATTRGTDDTHNQLLSAQRIARARSMMTPFILRRKKHQVLKHLPPKTRRVEYCDMTPSQQALYTAEWNRHKQAIIDRKAGLRKKNEQENVLMILRKAAIHPMLFRCHYTDAMLHDMAVAYVRAHPESQVALVEEDMGPMTDSELNYMCSTTEFDALGDFALQGEPWLDAGKVTTLLRLLQGYKAAGDRVLIFSQFTMVMNILEEALESASIKFFRLDGGTRIDTRQALIDEFYADASVTAFMLSTKAGGAGINLACANKVVVFDSSFNPQDDVQAENRAHRVGQQRPVEVVRLVTRGSIEEQILALGQTKLALDMRVAGEDGGAGGAGDGGGTGTGGAGADAKTAERAEKEGIAKVREMLALEAVADDTATAPTTSTTTATPTATAVARNTGVNDSNDTVVAVAKEDRADPAAASTKTMDAAAPAGEVPCVGGCGGDGGEGGGYGGGDDSGSDSPLSELMSD